MDDDFNIEPLREEEALDAGPIVEAAEQKLLVPKKGPIVAEDGTVKVAIIRPCVSRGRRLRGLPPIYTQEMLAENGGVFTGWPMFVDHMPPQVMQQIQKAGRSVLELGGRVIESWYDRDLKLREDADMEYHQGGVIGKVMPTKAIREMISEDPLLLHCSINAYPKAAKPGKAFGTRGMLIEGIRKLPMGSVDWVPRGGAGGRVLEQDVSLLVSILERLYDSGEMKPDKKALSELSNDELVEYLSSERPELAEQLNESEGGNGGGNNRPAPKDDPKPATSGDDKPLTESDAKRMIEESQSDFEERVKEEADERANRRIADERRRTTAHQLIEKAPGLPPRAKADLKARYVITESGVSPALVVEEVLTEGTDTVEKSADEVLVERVQADIQYVRDMIAEAQGGPAVRGDGRSKGGDGDGKPESKPYWREQAKLSEEDDQKAYLETLQEAV